MSDPKNPQFDGTPDPVLHVEEHDGTLFFSDPKNRNCRVRALAFVVMYESSSGPTFVLRTNGQWGDIAQSTANLMMTTPGLLEATMALANLLAVQRARI